MEETEGPKAEWSETSCQEWGKDQSELQLELIIHEQCPQTMLEGSCQRDSCQRDWVIFCSNGETQKLVSKRGTSQIGTRHTELG